MSVCRTSVIFILLISICTLQVMAKDDDWSEEEEYESFEEDSLDSLDSSEETPYTSDSQSKDEDNEEDKTVRIKRLILLLYERLFEPVVLPKGPKNTVLDIPDTYWVDLYKPHKAKYTDLDYLRHRYGVQVQEVVPIIDLGDKMPDLTLPVSSGHSASSYTYLIVNQPHMVVPVIEAFSSGSLEELLSLGCYLRDRYNPYMFVMTLTIALLSRPDTHNMRLPAFIKVFPNLYLPSATISASIQESFLADIGSRRTVVVPHEFTASVDEEEHKLAYFREDIGVNQHHWSWHLVYPSEGPLSIVSKPRRGELFYYMHQQIVARYNFERLSNSMARVSPLSDFREPIKEGYFSKLHSLGGNRTFPGRSANTFLSDLNRSADNLTLQIKDMEESRDRIYEAIKQGFIITYGFRKNLSLQPLPSGPLSIPIEAIRIPLWKKRPTSIKYVVKGEEKKIDYAVKSYLNPTPPLARKIQSRCRDDYHSSILQDAQFGSQYILRINPKENPVLFVGNESKKLSEKDGIDVLGNIVESNYLREGGEYYGDLHNSGHMAIALSHDPDYRYLEQSGVMADQATAMRDPAFYHWHQFLNDLFLKHKNLQPSYNEDQLKLDGVVINSVEITSEGQSEKDTFFTLWQQTDVDISKGLDYTPRGELFIRFTHLNHRAFTFNIQISNSGPTKTGICRIFLAPKYDERGLPFSFKHHKNNFIEMDKFIVKLKQGLNRIERHSTDSSVTIPFEALFQDSDPASQDNVLFSGCGWPEHLLVPKGSVAGTPSLLFIMVSDYTSDQVDDTQNLKHSGHKKSVNFCGLRDNMHPDKRSMGFPFDRLPRDGVSTLAEFLTPNMAVIETTIKFTNQVLPTKT